MTGRLTALLLLGAAAATLGLGEDPMLGMPPAEVAAFLAYGAALAWLTGWAVGWAEPTFRSAMGAVVMWAVFAGTLTLVFVKREEAVAGLRDIVEEVGVGAPPATLVTGAGEVTLTRRHAGSFWVPARIGDKPVGFVFDTGASTVVLRADTAEAVGFPTDALRFRVPVQTANGVTMAAPITLPRVAIGSIELANVRALVVPSRLLHENLLGQTVLDRLHSYEVRGDRLVLRARTG